MKNKKMARPVKIIKRQYPIKFRVTALEKRLIEHHASYSGLCIADFCRKASLGQKITFKLTEEELFAFKQLHELKAYMTSFANAFKARDSELHSLGKDLCAKINEQIAKFYDR